MPFQNNFGHQRYTADPPNTKYEIIRVDFPPQVDSPEFQSIFREFGECAHDQIDEICLVHGSFMGGDALGWNEQLGRLWPNLASKLTDLGKQFINKTSGTSGNYTPTFAEQFQNSIFENSNYDIPVWLFRWSSENTHVARCRAAIKFMGDVMRRQETSVSKGKRLLVLCHSHAGNVLAIVSNLLGADESVREQFFELLQPTFQNDDGEQEIFESVVSALRDSAFRKEIVLDVVTFGTPIRYGWETSGYRNLVHFVHHRVKDGHPKFLAATPKLSTEMISLAHGDFVQQLGIATTNFMPFVFDKNLVGIEKQLSQFVQNGIDREDFIKRLRMGMRVPNEGITLLVAYSDHLGLARKMAGHAIYTRPEWLAFHVKETTRLLYV